MRAPDHGALGARVRRAAASLPGAGRVLVVVGSSDGAASLKEALGAAPGLTLEVLDLPGCALLAFGAEGPPRRLATPAERDTLWQEANDPPASLPEPLLRREWDEVIRPQRIGSWAAYLKARRSGQQVVLSNEQKRSAWRVFERVAAALDAGGLWELADLVQASLARLSGPAGAVALFDAVVLDDPLPLRPSERELLARLCALGPRGLLDASTDPPAPLHDLEALASRQKKALTRFFQKPAQAGPAHEAAPAGEAPAPRAQLSLEAPEDGGGLVLVVPALDGLPASVERLGVRFDGGEATLLAGNVRTGASLVAVKPSAGGYAFDPPCQALSLGGLPTDRASVFRVRQDGRALLVPGRGATGRARLLVPPSLAAVELPAGAWSLGQGWRAVAVEVRPGETRLLEALGLEASAVSLSVWWAGLPPGAGWGAGGSGERYPQFGPGQIPLLGIELRGAPRALAVVETGPGGTTSLEVEAGVGAVFVELGGLWVGHHVVEVVSSTDDLSERLFFSIEPDAARPPRWVSTLWLGETAHALDEDPVVDADLSSASGANLSLRLPPWTRVDVSWRTTSSRWLGELWSGDDGTLGASELGALVGARPELEPVADLVLDAGDHGMAIVRHERPLRLDETVVELRHLFDERRDTLGLAEEDVDLFASLLVVPVCESLGYQVGHPVPFEGGSAVELWSFLREGGEVERAPLALAVAVRDRFLPSEPILPSLTARIQALLGRHDAARAIVAAGLTWFVVERGRRRPPVPLDLSPALGGDERTLAALARVGAA